MRLLLKRALPAIVAALAFTLALPAAATAAPQHPVVFDFRYFAPPLGEWGYQIFRALFPAVAQQAQYDELVDIIYRDGDTRPGPEYTTIISKYDSIATPYTNQLLEGPNVENIIVQDGCEKDLSEHISLNFSPRAWHHVHNTLSPAEATPVPCVQVDPLYPGLSEGR